MYEYYINTGRIFHSLVSHFQFQEKISTYLPRLTRLFERRIIELKEEINQESDQKMNEESRKKIANGRTLCNDTIKSQFNTIIKQLLLDNYVRFMYNKVNELHVPFHLFFFHTFYLHKESVEWFLNDLIFHNKPVNDSNNEKDFLDEFQLVLFEKKSVSSSSPKTYFAFYLFQKSLSFFDLFLKDYSLTEKSNTIVNIVQQFVTEHKNNLIYTFFHHFYFINILVQTFLIMFNLLLFHYLTISHEKLKQRFNIFIPTKKEHFEILANDTFELYEFREEEEEQEEEEEEGKKEKEEEEEGIVKKEIEKVNEQLENKKSISLKQFVQELLFLYTMIKLNLEKKLFSFDSQSILQGLSKQKNLLDILKNRFSQ